MPPTSPPPDVSPPPGLDDILADDYGSGHATSSSNPKRTPGRDRNLHHTSAARINAGTGSGSGQGADDIEMESIVAGHRRRRSSILNGFHHSPAGGSRGHRAQQSLSIPLQDEPKIAEEGRTTDEGSDDSISDEDLHDDEETGLTKKDKDRKRRKRRRNTLLDQRIAPDKITVEEKKEADQNIIRRIGINALLIGLWYLFSLCISLYNKWMFDQNRLNFAFPLFTTSAHMLIQFALSVVVLYFVPSLRPRHRHSSDLGRSRHEAEPNQPLMTKWYYMSRIAPCGAATGLDIGLGNTSLQFITLTFYTMCKSSALAFVLLFAFLFRLETPTWRLVAIIATMTLGVIMMVFGEVKFHLGGFVLVISAAFFSGFRWGLTQILLLRNPATSNPFSSIFYLAPIMFVTLALLAIPVEGFMGLIEGIKVLQAEFGTFLAPMFLLFPGCIAFCMTASEFALLQRTSVVTLSIAGIFKEVVTISAAALVFEDRLTFVNFIGLITTMAAIAAYNWFKLARMREEAQVEVHRDYLGVGSGSSSSNVMSDAELDEGGEETGLLRHSAEMPGLVITSDGEVLTTSPVNASEEEQDGHRR